MKNAAVPGFASARVLHGTPATNTYSFGIENLRPDVANM